MVNRNWLLTALVGMVLIYEATAIECIKCKDTDSDQSCAQGTGSASNCTLTEDVCYMRNNGGKIERGCLTDLPEEDRPYCQTVEGQSCMTCTGNDCNNAIWVKCHSCDNNSTCVETQAPAGAVFCSKYAKEDQCYAKVDGNKVTRGCKSDLPASNDVCTNIKYCDLCTGNGCNSLSGETLKTFTKCLVCNSTDAKCVDASSPVVECGNREDTCYTRVQDNVLERGCLSSLTTADQGKCQDNQDATCITCNDSEGCNKQNWLKCHQCKETNVTTCAEVQTDDKAQFCKAYKNGNQCYARLDSAKVVRGCENDLASNEDSCKNNRECRQCQDNGCNKEASTTLQNPDRCLQCSTRNNDDESCLLGTADSKVCAEESQKKCYLKIDKEGFLVRGCQVDLTAEDVTACTGETCELCESSKCSNIFPTNRRRCYQCKGNLDKTCSEEWIDVSKSSYCQVYKKDDNCYARILKEVFERGCQSSLNATACDGLTEKQCLSCTEDNCNTISQKKLNSAGQNTVSLILIVAVVSLVLFK